MKRYKLVNNPYGQLSPGIFDTETSQAVPEDLNNIDWQLYQNWLNQGNTPDPAN